MTSYAELTGWIEQGKPLRRLHYVYGEEHRLVESVVDLLKTRPVVGEVVTVSATGKNDGEIWGELNQYSAESTMVVGSRKVRRQRHVIVRSAERVSNFAPLESWLSQMRSVTACFVSERDFDGTLWGKARRCPRGHSLDGDGQSIVSTSHRRELRYCAECRRVRGLLIKKGRLVRCGKPTTDKQRDEMVNMIAARAGSSRGMAIELLKACEWSTGAAMESLERLRYLDLPLSELSIKKAVIRSASGDFVEALRRGDTGTAATLAGSIDPDAVPAVLSECERWLGQAQRGSSAVRSGRSTAEIVRLLGVSWGEAEAMRRNAGKYSIAAISRATEALAAADQAYYRDRGRDGVLELLAGSW